MDSDKPYKGPADKYGLQNRPNDFKLPESNGEPIQRGGLGHPSDTDESKKPASR